MLSPNDLPRAWAAQEMGLLRMEERRMCVISSDPISAGAGPESTTSDVHGSTRLHTVPNLFHPARPQLNRLPCIRLCSLEPTCDRVYPAFAPWSSQDTLNEHLHWTQHLLCPRVKCPCGLRKVSRRFFGWLCWLLSADDPLRSYSVRKWSRREPWVQKKEKWCVEGPSASKGVHLIPWNYRACVSFIDLYSYADR